MENIDLLKEAIRRRKPIEYEYNRPDKVPGKRIGNPHVAFSGVTKEGVRRIWTHIAQTGGVSDTLKEFPDWRMFITEYVTDVRILEEEPEFTLQEGYNPYSDMYSEVIAKV